MRTIFKPGEDAGGQSFDLIKPRKESWLANLENWTVRPNKNKNCPIFVWWSPYIWKFVWIQKPANWNNCKISKCQKALRADPSNWNDWQEYSFQITMRQQWNDKRLMYKEKLTKIMAGERSMPQPYLQPLCWSNWLPVDIWGQFQNHIQDTDCF